MLDMTFPMSEAPLREIEVFHYERGWLLVEPDHEANYWLPERSWQHENDEGHRISEGDLEGWRHYAPKRCETNKVAPNGNCSYCGAANGEACLRLPPLYANVSCSNCGQDFGPGNHGFSHCHSHVGKIPHEDGTTPERAEQESNGDMT